MRELDIVRAFRGARVLLLGDAMLDTYLEGEAVRLCREGPVPVVRSSGEEDVPGGAANTAANLSALGADVRYLGVIGSDDCGAKLRAALNREGVDDAHLVRLSRCSTLQKVRIVANGQYVVRYDSGAMRPMEEQELDQFLKRLSSLHATCDVVIISDYNYGAVPDEAIPHLSELSQARNKPLVIDAKDLNRFASLRTTVVTPNEDEARTAVGETTTAGRDGELLRIERIGSRLLQKLDTQHAAITLAGDGVLLCSRGQTRHFPARSVERPNDVGAGDSFTASISLALACGASVEEAAGIAIEAAAIAVTKERTAVVHHRELLRRASRGLEAEAEPLDAVVAEVERHRRAGRKIVFTNGVFDILHAGHVHFLREARKLGDVLIVGLNSDRSAQRLRGRHHPINSERERLDLVAALDPVDHVVCFDEDSPVELIRSIRPEVHVKGGDYAHEPLAEAQAVQEVGGELVILPFGEERSTSEVIERIVTLVTA